MSRSWGRDLSWWLVSLLVWRRQLPPGPAGSSLCSAAHQGWAPFTSQVHTALQQNKGFELERWRMKIQTNGVSPRSVDKCFPKLSLITVYEIFSRFPELTFTEQSSEGQHPDCPDNLNCYIKLHKKNGKLWTYYITSSTLFWF